MSSAGLNTQSINISHSKFISSNLTTENNLKTKYPVEVSKENINDFSINKIKNKTKSIDFKKYYHSIKNPYKNFKELDLYTDPKKSFEIKMIENLHNANLKKKYPVDFLRKIDHLLKNKDTKYSMKRENLDKTIFKLDNNHNLYLTLEKFNNNNYQIYNKNSQINPNTKEIILNDNKLIYKYITLKPIDNVTDKTKISNRKNNIPEFSNDNYETKSDEDESELIKKIPEKLVVESDSSIIDEKEKNILFKKISKTQKLNKIFKTSKPLFNKSLKINEQFNLKESVNIQSFTHNNNYANSNTTPIFSPKRINLKKKINLKYINYKHSMKGNIHKITDIQYDNSIENIKRLSHEIHLIRKDKEKHLPAVKVKLQDVNKSLKDANSIIKGIMSLDEKRLLRITNLKNNIEVEKNKI